MARTGTEFARISGSYKTHNIGTYQLSSQDVINNKSYFKLRDYFTYEGGTQVTSSYSTFKIFNNSCIYQTSFLVCFIITKNQ